MGFFFWLLKNRRNLIDIREKNLILDSFVVDYLTQCIIHCYLPLFGQEATDGRSDLPDGTESIDSLERNLSEAFKSESQ